MDYKCVVSFRCPQCQENTSALIDAPEPHWTADKASDMIADCDTEIPCGECDQVFLARVFNSGGQCTVTFRDHLETTVDADHAFYSSDEVATEYDAPDDPHSIFMDSYHETTDLLSDRGTEHAGIINRMILSQQIAALEAYLADTLLNGVLADEDAIKRLLNSEQELSKLKASLFEIYKDPEFVKNAIKRHLRAILYHNLAKVRVLYRIAFEFDFYTLVPNQDMKWLFKAIEYRHHCVHRNGYDDDGNFISEIDRDYVSATADILKRFVSAVDHCTVAYMLKREDLANIEW